jgi:hypothetical protein
MQIVACDNDEYNFYWIFRLSLRCTRAIWKLTPSELLTKQETRKNYCYYVQKYILKLRLSVITVRIEALVISGNKFLCLCLKCLPPVSLASHLERDQGCKEVSQLPVVMQCSKLSSCMQTHIVIGEHYTRCHCSMPFVLDIYTLFFGVPQYTFNTILVPWGINFTINSLSLSQKTGAISFLIGRQCLFKLVGLVSWMCVHPSLWLLFGFTVHKWNQVSSPDACRMWVRHSSPSLWYHSKNIKAEVIHLMLVGCEWDICHHLCSITPKTSKPKSFSVFCGHPWAFLEPILHRTGVSLAYLRESYREQCMKLVEIHTKVLNCQVPSSTYPLSNTYYTSFFILNVCLIIQQCLTVASCITFWPHKLCIIRDGWQLCEFSSWRDFQSQDTL